MKYSKIPSEEGEKVRPARFPVLLAHAVLVVLYSAVFIGATVYTLWPQRHSILDDAIHHVEREVGYNFEDVNPFKGQAIQDIDAQWLKLINQPHELRIPPKEAARSNFSSIEVADGTHDRIGQPIAFHMLHCLYNIFKYAHPDFYGPDPSGPAWVVEHTDHCVDNLRQFVQCHAGTGIAHYEWLPDRFIPYPVINTVETCVDWDHYTSWVEQRSVPIEELSSMHGLFVHPTLGPLDIEHYKEMEEKLRKTGHKAAQDGPS